MRQASDGGTVERTVLKERVIVRKRVAEDERHRRRPAQERVEIEADEGVELGD